MEDMTALHPRLQEKAAQLKTDCAAQGIQILFGECVRTAAEQDTLYAQGRTVPGEIVTNARGSTYSSQHQWGIAVDFYLDMDVDKDGKKGDDAFNNSTGLFEQVGAIAKPLGLGWGGDWKSFQDRPHLYLPDWGSTTDALKEQYGTPEAFMAAWQKGTTGYGRTQFISDVQRCTGSGVDGKAGQETIENTITVSRQKNQFHPVVTPLERYLKYLGYYIGEIEEEKGRNPCFGGGMESAVKAYQQDHDCIADGIVTAKNKTWKSLLGMI